jgi:hypothetical protein
MRALLALALLCFLPPLAAQPRERREVPERAVLEALVTDERMGEISGLAASRRHADTFWVHNDGDNPAEVYAMDGKGVHRATLRIRGLRNIDWEDIDVFEHDGRSYLLIADVGDNGGMRGELRLIVVEEPAELTDSERDPAWIVRFRWPDGARDCEAVAVDAREGSVLLISKKRVPPELFRLALRPAGDAMQIAQRIGTLAGIEQPTPEDLRRNPVYGRYRSQITAADISADGRLLAVLNYRTAYLWSRDPRGWSETVQRPPRILDFPWVPQAEAIGFDRDGLSLWIGSERLPAPLLRLPLKTEKAR